MLNPGHLNMESNSLLENLTQKYPYFSISHILLAKGLLNTDSIRYNRKLKKAAIYSIERKYLFKLITQNIYDNKLVVQKESHTKFNDVKNPKHNQRIEQRLNIGTPLDFNENEEHSFSEWLSLSKIKKIDRKNIKDNKDLIDNFIENKPRITVEKNKFFSPTKAARDSIKEKDEFVTETLARVYLEQKHFDKAIDAYKKLSLKYPKKNGFFAGQIKLINDLKKEIK